MSETPEQELARLREENEKYRNASVKPEPPLWMQESFWFAVGGSILGAVAAVPDMVTALLPFIPEANVDLRLKLAAAAAVCGAIAARRARIPGAEARAALPAVEVKADNAQAVAVEANTRAAAVEQATGASQVSSATGGNDLGGTVPGWVEPS